MKNLSDTEIENFPECFISDSPYSKITDFDKNVKEYCKAYSFHKSKQELENRLKLIHKISKFNLIKV